MKKLAKLLCVISVVLCLAVAFAACGGGKTYTYSDTKLEVSAPGLPADAQAQLKTQFGMLETTYDAMFKDSKIEVSDSKIVWTVSDQKQELSVKKDGDKDVISGDFMDQLSAAMGATAGANATYSMYGQNTDAGYSIVYEVAMSVGGTDMTLTMSYNFK